MEQSVWDRVRECFLMQHTGEGAKKGSGVVERDVRSKAGLGQEGKQVTARSSLCSWVLGGAEDTEGKALAALNESHREERWEQDGGDQAGSCHSARVGSFPRMS